jgi:hypothetical protein
MRSDLHRSRTELDPGFRRAALALVNRRIASVEGVPSDGGNDQGGSWFAHHPGHDLPTSIQRGAKGQRRVEDEGEEDGQPNECSRTPDHVPIPSRTAGPVEWLRRVN